MSDWEDVAFGSPSQDDWEDVPQSKRSWGQDISGGARQLGQGATLGFADEIEAMVGGLAGKLGAWSAGGEVPDFKQIEGERLADIRGQNKAFEKANPKSAIALQLLGGLPTAAVLPGGMVKGGATAGALYGFGGSEGDFTERATGAGLGAAGGAIAGKLLDEGIGLAQKGLQSETVQRLARRLADERGAAGPKAPKASFPSLSPDEMAFMEASRGSAPNQLRSGVLELRRAQSAGQRMLPSEALDDPTLAALTDAMHTSTEGRGLAGAVLQQRDRATRGRLKSSLTDIAPELSPHEGSYELIQGAKQLVGGMKKARSKAAAPAYKLAEEAMPIIDTPELGEVLESKLISPIIEKLKADFPKKYGALPDNHITLLNKVKQRLDKKIGSLKINDPHGEFVDFVDLNKQLKGAIDNAGPEYRSARKLYQEMSIPIEKLTGKKKEFRGVLEDILSVDPENSIRASRRLMTKSPEQIAQIKAILGDTYADKFNAGVRAHLEDELERASTKTGFGPFRKYVLSDDGKNRLSAALGEDKYQKFATYIEREFKMAESSQKIQGGSPTAGRLEHLNKQKGIASRALKFLSSLTSPGKAATRAVEAYEEGMSSPLQEMIKKIGGTLYGSPAETIPTIERVTQYREARDPYIAEIAKRMMTGRKYGKTAGGESGSQVRRYLSGDE